jgi:hypothetical protein
MALNLPTTVAGASLGTDASPLGTWGDLQRIMGMGPALQSLSPASTCPRWLMACGQVQDICCASVSDHVSWPEVEK